MRTALLLFFVLFVCLASVQDTRGKRPKKMCKRPKGKPGTIFYKNCEKYQCIKKNRKYIWNKTSAKEKCCFLDNTGFPLGSTIMSEKTSADSCAVASLKCGDVKGMPGPVMDIQNVCPVCTTRPPTTTTTYGEVPVYLTTTTTKAQNAVLIIGGWDNPGNAEVFFPDTAIGCSVPFYSFRDKVHSTTMDTVGDKTLICGGGGSSKECFQFTPVGSATAWRKYSDLNITRYEHTSWASKQGPVLIGGYEPSGKNAEKTAELNGRILPFSLPSTRDACAITDSDTDSVIVTGGDSTKIKASRYNMNGLVEELPTLNRGRSRHGCGSYTSSNKLVLIVAGGDNAGGKTTEKFMIGDTAWTLVGNLPRSTFWISGATISMNNKIYIFGGDEGATNRAITDILEYEAEQDTWNKIGDMKRGRYRHATAVIEADQATLCATK